MKAAFQTMKRHAAPIIAAILLLLPVLYVGSYLAFVVPGRIQVFRGTSTVSGSDIEGEIVEPVYSRQHYRFGSPQIDPLFWPLEEIDRTLRPGAWVVPSREGGSFIPVRE
jgi:hypothetical protein